METNEVLIPNGYKFFEVEDNPMLGSNNKKEEFAVKNRSFSKQSFLKCLEDLF